MGGKLMKWNKNIVCVHRVEGKSEITLSYWFTCQEKKVSLTNIRNVEEGGNNEVSTLN